MNKKTTRLCLLAGVVMVACIVLCALPQRNVKDEEDPQETPVCGGYSDPREPSEEDMALFRKVTGEGDMVLTPITVSSQVVAGMNYEFYCSYEDKAHNAFGNCHVYIYQPLDGEPEMTNITLEK